MCNSDRLIVSVAHASLELEKQNKTLYYNTPKCIVEMTTLSHFSHCDTANLATPGHRNKQQLRPKNQKENRTDVFISIHVDFFFGIIINSINTPISSNDNGALKHSKTTLKSCKTLSA